MNSVCTLCCDGCKEHGERVERDRIIKLLEEHDAEISRDYLITLIKGEQK